MFFRCFKINLYLSCFWLPLACLAFLLVLLFTCIVLCSWLRLLFHQCFSVTYNFLPLSDLKHYIRRWNFFFQNFGVSITFIEGTFFLSFDDSYCI